MKCFVLACTPGPLFRIPSGEEGSFEFPFLGYKDTIIPGFWEIGLRSVVTHAEVESRLFMSLDGVNKASTAKWSVN